jgi:hypothetical protein
LMMEVVMSIENVGRKKSTPWFDARLGAGLFEGEARREARRKRKVRLKAARQEAKEKTRTMAAKQFNAD